MDFTSHPSFHMRLVEFLGFFPPLNIFLYLFWRFSGQHLGFLQGIGATLFFFLVNGLFVLYFLLRWKTIQGSSGFFSSFTAGAKKFGQGITTAINTVLLLFVYILGVGSTFVLAKLLRKHFLSLKPVNTSTYYLPKEQSSSKDQFYRQY